MERLYLCRNSTVDSASRLINGLQFVWLSSVFCLCSFSHAVYAVTLPRTIDRESMPATLDSELEQLRARTAQRYPSLALSRRDVDFSTRRARPSSSSNATLSCIMMLRRKLGGDVLTVIATALDLSAVRWILPFTVTSLVHIVQPVSEHTALFVTCAIDFHRCYGLASNS
jgi:hypothetical protein